MTTTRLAPLSLLLLLPLALGACGGEPATPPRAATTTVPAAPDRSADPAPPPTAPSAPPPARPAPPARTPQPAAPVAERPAAGRPPRATVTGDADSLRTGAWTLLVTSASGTVDGAIRAEPQVRPEVLGIVDADRDGDWEIFVSVGAGASTTTYAVFTVVEDGAAEVRTSTGAPVRLTVGGSVTHGDGFGCARGRLVVHAVASSDGETFRGTSVTYTWRDDLVTETGRTTFTGSAGDPAVRAAYGIDCAGLAQHG